MTKKKVGNGALRDAPEIVALAERMEAILSKNEDDKTAFKEKIEAERKNLADIIERQDAALKSGDRETYISTSNERNASESFIRSFENKLKAWEEHWTSFEPLASKSEYEEALNLIYDSAKAIKEKTAKAVLPLLQELLSICDAYIDDLRYADELLYTWQREICRDTMITAHGKIRAPRDEQIYDNTLRYVKGFLERAITNAEAGVKEPTRR